MHNRALHDTLAAFVEEAAEELAAEVAGGAEIPFELHSNPPSRAGAPLYCYRPQTAAFLARRSDALTRLPSYPIATQQLAALPRLEAYFEVRGERAPAGDRRTRAAAALELLLATLWADSDDFALEGRRFATAYAELESAAYDGCSLTVVLAPVEGLVIDSDEVPLGDGLSLARADVLVEAPGDLRTDPFATVAIRALESGTGEPTGLEAAGRRLRRLQTALRLWDDAEPAIGPTAWARTDGAPWLQVSLTGGVRRAAEDCLVAPEEEDALRAFCSLVTRRTPRAGELAWALRRFELGCERPRALDALTDWLLAARAILADPAAHGYEGMVPRLAAICAAPADRDALGERLSRAIALERAAVAGLVRSEPEVEAPVLELGAQVRAVLRDVLCGHLDPDLRGLGDRLIAEAQAAQRIEHGTTSDLPSL